MTVFFLPPERPDPRSVARWMRRMRRQMGEDLGEEFDHVVEEMEAGAGGEGPTEQ